MHSHRRITLLSILFCIVSVIGIYLIHGPAAISQTSAKKTAVKKVRKAPQGFIGANFNPWEIIDHGGDIASELQTAGASGIESIRFPLYWFRIQPYSSMRSVPGSRMADFTPAPDGSAPSDWTKLDKLMIKSASLNISVVPTVMGSPLWADDPRYEDDPKLAMPVPARFEDYNRFLQSVVNRYKASSNFWSEHNIQPVKVVGWQIWNEPDHPNFWPAHVGEKNGPRGSKLGWAPSYVQLFSGAQSTVKSADPTARVMLASLLSVPQTPLAQYYAAGGKNTFNSLATNMFTTASGILNRMKDFRTALRLKGAGAAPIYLTEFSFLSGKGTLGPSNSLMMNTINTTAALQGKYAVATLTGVVNGRAASNIAGIYWYSWVSPDLPPSPWDFAGLRWYGPKGIVDKPSRPQFSQAALALEGR